MLFLMLPMTGVVLGSNQENVYFTHTHTHTHCCNGRFQVNPD